MIVEVDKEVNECRDGMSQGIIRSMMMPDEASKLGICETAGDLWKKIQGTYEGPREHIKRFAGRLFMQFRAIKSESLANLCGSYEELIGKLAVVDHYLGEGEKIFQLQQACLAKLKERIDYWQLAKPDGELDDLIRDLRCIRSDDDEITEQALFANPKASYKEPFEKLAPNSNKQTNKFKNIACSNFN